MSIGLSLGLIAALCWGSTDVSAAVAGRRLGSLWVTAIVQVTSLTLILVLCAIRGSWFPSQWLGLVGIGLGLAAVALP